MRVEVGSRTRPDTTSPIRNRWNAPPDSDIQALLAPHIWAGIWVGLAAELNNTAHNYYYQLQFPHKGATGNAPH